MVFRFAMKIDSPEIWLQFLTILRQLQNKKNKTKDKNLLFNSKTDEKC